MNNKTTIIYVHPYDKSYNHAVLDTIISDKKQKKINYNLINIYKDGFNPVYSTEELSLFKTGETLDPLVKEYQRQLKETKRLIIITPIWWNDIPAILKGFFDKVLKMNFAYVSGRTGVKGLLTNIYSAEVITTSTSPKFYIKYFSGNCINGSVRSTLKQIGVKKFSWKHLGNINNSTNEKRKKFLQSLNN
ncbi:NAD(P)H dehydrogenase [Leuconostoc gasicomitatum]|uniref:NAD(P)H dehydrogenase, quinone family n=2 Tax=Leuconostoc TaxID=1243 RepID=A0AAN2UH46_9LACO|nr:MULTISPECIES: NAD(P)H-dependent oxidoreductase [Leuconostoc]MBZ5956702.1 NAD(P)H-dependent oxidoreductase [Leuconostoc gasicomitatum]MBZ5958229.1 NAD(P)H-dependent oxidoreductase [Leuconostoc gasicomitatum]MBZ5966546.1 NAD(P)H-dependent oxidoreductase [Leuconostoc gasicomitatum]MBZ5980149.1 NAD(P)H-dependent oxidoreductase [Leuconostoc gasicomitatum]MBZ5981559.1 NAD(P)H-dependent oxidoreductase [Leuconostoc gasicomitatum]